MPTSDSEYVYRNWDRTLECRPRACYQPDSEEDVVAIVAEVEARGGTLRAFGAGHSWSPLVPTDDSLINLDALDRLVSVDAARHRVTVQAGIRIKALVELLAQNGLAMKNLGSIAEQSIAGAFSTGTHGTGIALGIIATQIVAMRLVGSGGRYIEIDADTQPELMSAVRVSLGAFGIITQVTLQCVPAHRLKLTAYPLPFADAVAQIPSLVAANGRVRLYWFANTDVIQVMLYNETTDPITPANRFAEWFQNVVIKYDFYEFLNDNGYQIPGLVASVNQLGAKIGWVKEERVDRSDRILVIPMPPPHQECEYAIPVDKAPDAVRLVRKLVEAAGYHANIPVEVRFTAADDIMLSPCSGRASCYLGAYTFGEQFAQPYFDGFEGLMKSLGGRAHWGKRHVTSPAELRALYPAYDRWNALRRQIDPKGTFANSYIRDMFP